MRPASCLTDLAGRSRNTGSLTKKADVLQKTCEVRFSIKHVFRLEVSPADPFAVPEGKCSLLPERDSSTCRMPRSDQDSFLTGLQKMGLLRLFLATLVVISHLGIDFYGWNVGVWAVVIFYMLAGHVVAKLWSRRPSGGFFTSLGWFYKDRALRIFPLYFAALLVSGLVWALGAQSHFLSKQPGLTDWLSNLAIVPLNFYMWTGIDRFTLVPPAWSLGAELQFYLLLPLLMLWPRLAIATAAGSVLVFSFAQLGLLNTDIYGYRLLLGVLFIFLSGTVIEKPSVAGYAALIALWLALLLYGVILEVNDIRRPYDFEVAMGYLVGFPLLVIMSKARLAGRWHTLQSHAGSMSYGIFVFHFPMIWIVEMYDVPVAFRLLPVMLGSMLLALIFHHALERPMWRKFRKKLPEASAPEGK